MVGELAFVAGKVGSLPPCGGELERGVSPGFGARGLPPSLTLPHKGGGNESASAGGHLVQLEDAP